jgi:hypothetical protein
MSYILPTNEISYAAQAQLRMQAQDQGMARAVQMRVASSTSGLAVRDPDYPIDFVPAATRAGLSGWLTMPLAAAGNLYSVFADNVPAALTPQVPNNAVWVFYKATILTVGDPVSELYFLIGQAGNRKAQFNLEILQDKLEVDGYFSEPIVYDPQDIVTVQVRARVINPAARVVLGAFIIEPLQVSVV